MNFIIFVYPPSEQQLEENSKMEGNRGADIFPSGWLSSGSLGGMTELSDFICSTQASGSGIQISLTVSDPGRSKTQRIEISLNTC